MTLDDALMFSDHFKRHLPLRVLVMACAAALGVKFPEFESKKPESKYLTAEEFRRIVQTTGGRVPGMGGS